MRRVQSLTFLSRYNIVFPCMMMSTLTVLVFCLPPDSGEKIALGVTVLLAFSGMPPLRHELLIIKRKICLVDFEFLLNSTNQDSIP